MPVVAGVVRLSGLASSGAVTPENVRFVAMRATVALHIVCASLSCAIGTFQSDSVLRQHSPCLHRIAGRLIAPCGIVAALTGLWMTADYAMPAERQGRLGGRVRIVVGLAMVLAVGVSIRAIAQRLVAQHRAWMIRAYALGQGAGTQMLLLLPVTVMAGTPTFIFRDVLMASARALNVAFAGSISRRRLPST